MERDYWEELISRIETDLGTADSLVNLTAALWYGSDDEQFKGLLKDAMQANGALLVFLKRQLFEVEYFRKHPPIIPSPYIHGVDDMLVSPNK